MALGVARSDYRRQFDGTGRTWRLAHVVQVDDSGGACRRDSLFPHRWVPERTRRVEDQGFPASGLQG